MQHIRYKEVQAAVVVLVSLDVTSLRLVVTTTQYLYQYLSAGRE